MYNHIRAGVLGRHVESGNSGKLGTSGSGVEGRNSASDNLGLLGTPSYGVYGKAGNATSYGIAGEGENIAIWANNTASGKNAYLGTPALAGDFYGDVIVHGTTRTDVLTITGGSDVAEPFSVGEERLAAGTVVVIDEGRPGRLKVSDREYDRRVAGVVSGANGVAPGLTLYDDSVGGDQLVALTGRVYALADASTAPIRPGDLLTTSGVPGRAMKALDSARTTGAVLGKALTSLEGGQGLVLVLVSLQ
jgi:hypothetical protein